MSGTAQGGTVLHSTGQSGKQHLGTCTWGLYWPRWNVGPVTVGWRGLGGTEFPPLPASWNRAVKKSCRFAGDGDVCVLFVLTLEIADATEYLAAWPRRPRQGQLGPPPT